jgi:hypothetical protein
MERKWQYLHLNFHYRSGDVIEFKIEPISTIVLQEVLQIYKESFSINYQSNKNLFEIRVKNQELNDFLVYLLNYLGNQGWELIVSNEISYYTRALFRIGNVILANKPSYLFKKEVIPK